jgi:predicted nucleic acid-binding protein
VKKETVASKVCVDASLALKLVLSEADSDQAEAEWQNWIRSGIEIEAPFLFIYETTSVLRNRVYRREITQIEAEEALGILAGFRITYLHPPALRQTAWELAHRFNRPAAYDGFYLALAQLEGCSFWTGDRRLYNAVKSGLEWVYVLREP